QRADVDEEEPAQGQEAVEGEVREQRAGDVDDDGRGQPQRPRLPQGGGQQHGRRRAEQVEGARGRQRQRRRRRAEADGQRRRQPGEGDPPPQARREVGERSAEHRAEERHGGQRQAVRRLLAEAGQPVEDGRAHAGPRGRDHQQGGGPGPEAPGGGGGAYYSARSLRRVVTKHVSYP